MTDIDQPFAHAAEIYRERGWSSPVPLGSAGDRAQKAPVPKGVTGRDARVPTDAVIANWMRTYAENNIGLHMDPEAGVIGIDVDEYVKGLKEKHGLATLKEIEERLDCGWPETIMSTARDPRTGSGIYFYRVPPGVELATSYPDVEIIQPKHRYAVVWPSIHPDTGKMYRWYGKGSYVPLKLPPYVDEAPELPKPILSMMMDDARGMVGLNARRDSSVSVDDWLAEDAHDRMCRAMRHVCAVECARFDSVDAGARYDTMNAGVMALVKLSAEGHHGINRALDKLQNAYEAATDDDAGRDTDGEWQRSLVGAVERVAGTEDEPHDSKCPDRPISGSAAPAGDEWPSPSDPAKVAERLVAELWDGNGLIHWRGDFYEHTGSFWRVLPPDDLRARCWSALRGVSYVGADLTPKGWNPNKTKIANVIEGLATTVHRSTLLDIDRGTSEFALIPFRNVVLKLARDSGERSLVPHSPEFFNTFALPFDYDESAPDPIEWFAFLKSLEIDQDVIDLLQEFFGYVVSGDTSKHRMLYLYGATRAGKGVITRVLQQLVGDENFASPNLAQFGETFGLQSSIGKALITINDARFRGAKIGELVERLLNFTGGDEMDISRKNLTTWHGTPTARVMIVSNDLPGANIGESSTALSKRFLGPIELHKTFYDHEDEQLERRLRGELSSIIMWALDGYDALCEQERFTVPESSRRLHEEMTDGISPVRKFVSDRCVLGSDERVANDELYRAYRDWATDSGLFVMNAIDFGRQLKDSCDAPIKKGKVRVGRGDFARRDGWVGVGLVKLTGSL